MQDPELYMKGLGIGVPCVVRKGSPAMVDSTMRTYVGHGIFFFSGTEERDRRGRPYYFASDSSRAAFVSMPDSFAVRKGM